MKLKDLTPNLMVKDVNQTVDFYRDHLGFTLSMSVPDTGTFSWALMHHEEISIMFQTQESLAEDLPLVNTRTSMGGALFYLNVEGIHEWYEKLKEVTTVLSPPAEKFYGATEFSFLDCNGYIITFAEDLDQ